MTSRVPMSPDCLGCRHFFITYQPRQPRGCRAYGFKSHQMPSRVVLASSGKPCQLFAPKSAGKGK